MRTATRRRPWRKKASKGNARRHPPAGPCTVAHLAAVHRKVDPIPAIRASCDRLGIAPQKRRDSKTIPCTIRPIGNSAAAYPVRRRNAGKRMRHPDDPHPGFRYRFQHYGVSLRQFIQTRHHILLHRRRQLVYRRCAPCSDPSPINLQPQLRNECIHSEVFYNSFGD